jgi:undecaprenyl-diphosphatase
VVVLYWRSFLQSTSFYVKLFVAFLPGAIIGFLLNNFIDSLLESAAVVAVMLILGGMVLLFIDKWLANKANNESIDLPKALKIGLFQCIALVPGVSRSAATIIGGMLQGLSKKTAAEFSFFLAVPTMFAASAYKLLKTYKTIQPDDITLLLVGNAVAFVVAMAAIRFFVGFLVKHGFRIFGYYRIALGVVILAVLATGYKLEIV